MIDIMNRIVFPFIVFFALAANALAQADETLITIGNTKVSKGSLNVFIRKTIIIYITKPIEKPLKNICNCLSISNLK
jgi:hypothetical protein